jgi:hypothetical protein
MPVYLSRAISSAEPPRLYSAFEPIPDHVELPGCAKLHIITEEQAAAERESAAEKEVARLRRAKARAEAG